MTSVSEEEFPVIQDIIPDPSPEIRELIVGFKRKLKAEATGATTLESEFHPQIPSLSTFSFETSFTSFV